MRHFLGKVAFGKAAFGEAARIAAPRIIPLTALVFALLILTSCRKGEDSAFTGPGVAPPPALPPALPAAGPVASGPPAPAKSQAAGPVPAPAADPESAENPATNPLPAPAPDPDSAEDPAPEPEPAAKPGPAPVSAEKPPPASGQTPSPGTGRTPPAPVTSLTSGTPVTSPMSGTETDTFDPVVDPANTFEAISWRLAGGRADASAFSAMSVMPDGTLNVPGVGTIPARRVNIVKSDSPFLTTPNLSHIEFGVWAEGDIPSSGRAGATFPTGSFFRGLGTDAARGLTTEQALRYDGITVRGETIGVAGRFSWSGQYVGYVEDGRPNYRNADADGNPQGTVGVSRVNGSMELYLVWPSGGEKGSVEVALGAPARGAGLGRFSPGFDSSDEWRYSQQVRFTGISANPSGTFEAYADYPVIRVTQSLPLPGSDFVRTPATTAEEFAAHLAANPWLLDGCAQACLYPHGVPAEEGQVLGGFYGPAAQEAGGIYRFTIKTLHGDVRATGAFGAGREADDTAGANP